MADNHDNEAIRRGLALLVEDAPLAPDFDDLTTTRVRPIETNRPKPLAVAGLSAAAVVLTFVGGAIWVGQSGGQADQAADTPLAPNETAATTPSTVANLEPGAFPHVVLDASGWSVAFVDQTKVSNADGVFVVSDVVFSNGEEEAELRMDSGAHVDLDALIADRVTDASRLADQAIWDATAVVVDTGGAANFTAMWESNAVEYEFVALDIDQETFRSLLSSLIQTSEEHWNSSLSEDIVTDRAQAVSAYLEDVPLPPNFDVLALEEGPSEHWYPVAAETISRVTCSWIELWIDAKATGDTEAVQRAVDAMATSHDWPVLDDMLAVGDYSQVVWEYADAMSGDGTIVAGSVTTVEASYQQALGCGS